MSQDDQTSDPPAVGTKSTFIWVKHQAGPTHPAGISVHFLSGLGILQSLPQKVLQEMTTEKDVLPP